MEAVYEKAFDNWTIKEKIREDATGILYKMTTVADNGKHTESMMKVIPIPVNREEYQEAKKGRSKEQVVSYYKGIIEKMTTELVNIAKAPDHSNIVRYEDCKVIPRVDKFGWYICVRMENLLLYDEWIANKELSEKQILQRGVELANALDNCKKLNVVHRDVSPSNLYVTRGGVLKLGGFGIPKDADRIAAGIDVPDPGPYMAPEIVQGNFCDISSDIYSAGVLLYSLCNGGVMPGTPLEAPAYVSEPFADIILKTLSPNPRERHQSASGLKYDLMDLQKEITGDDKVYTKEHIEEAQQRQQKELEAAARKKGGVNMFKDMAARSAHTDFMSSLKKKFR